jgi:protein TonB
MFLARAFAADLWYCNPRCAPRTMSLARRILTPPRQTVLAYATSWLVHLSALAYLARFADQSPAMLPVEEGGAAIALVASTSAADVERPIEVPAKLFATERLEPRRIQPADTVVEKDQPTVLPQLPIERPPLVQQSELVASLAQRRTPETEIPQPPPPPAPARDSAPPQVAKPTAQPLAEVATDAPQSAMSQQVVGAEVDVLPRKLATNPAPRYPQAAIAAGEQGVVLLLVRVSSAGTVESLRVSQSSGFSRLDAAALETVRGWRFEPARRNGAAVPYEVEVPIRFNLRRS